MRYFEWELKNVVFLDFNRQAFQGDGFLRTVKIDDKHRKFNQPVLTLCFQTGYLLIV